MKFTTLAGAVSVAALLAAAPAASAQSMTAQDHAAQNHSAMGHAEVTVGGAAMYPTKTIVENAIASPIHTTLVAAVKAAGLVETLSGPGPFTVFAPTDDAFAALPAGTVETLVMPENKATLTKILTYHVVAGRVTAADVVALIEAGGGSAALTTVEGGVLTASLNGATVVLTDEKGGTARVTQADVFQSNGVIHVTDAVSMPD
ncbi:MAG: fasciclin domain-containing protein [Brevundimonas sp.]|nr:MAG: fasciclin domain-containing protein [Brevundimonas sp.]